MGRGVRTPLALFGALCLLMLPNLGRSEPALVLPKARDGLFCDLATNGQVRVAVGERGHIFTAPIGDSHFEQTPCPVDEFLTAVAYDGQGHFWVTGHDQLLLRGDKTGRQWEVIRKEIDPGYPLFDLAFLPSGQGVAVGAFGQILYTPDAGVTWSPIALDDIDPHLYQVTIGPADTFYLAGEFGSLLRIDAQGKITHQLDTGSEATFFGVAVQDEQHLTVYGLRGFILRTEDGLHFTRQDAPVKATFYNHLTVNNTLWLVGDNGILYSPDTGEQRSAGEERGLVITSGKSVDSHELLLTTTSGIRAYAL